MREWLARIRDWLRRDQLERELLEELRFHRQHIERDALNAGLPASEAARAARRRLGNLTRIREDARERWSLPTLDQLQQDVGYAVRGLRRAPGFTTCAILTLALIGYVIAFAGSRWVEPLLFQQSATDPAIYALIGAIMLLVAVLAAAVPALHATRADPNTALRSG